MDFVILMKPLPDYLCKPFVLYLDKIFKPDAKFTDIVCQQLSNGTWEIYLEEEKKGRIPLSQSGSGLKTIILVLVSIHLVPVVIATKNLSDYVFGFEELENNLHPALLRRLLSYLYEQAINKGCIFFLTTHSNVEIDFFSKNKHAQIIHVTHDGTQAYCRTVQTYIDNKGVLDDLDVRASDLLQSNGLIWVEGPSDRIYLNRWITLWSDGELSEGNHYQCVFYGGRLLSHLSSDEPALVEEGVSILKVNKNAVILIDSDRKKQNSPLNSTKRRIISEMESNGSLAWTTSGTEIENYLSSDAIAQFFNLNSVQQVGRYANFFEYLNGIKSGKGDRYVNQKPLLAEKLSPYITRENSVGVLDLKDKLEKVCNLIRRWNSI
jgi:putative ATP-dependent endonuclease of the OLD family